MCRSFLFSCRAHSRIGQVYHTLLQERDDKGINDVVISRVEQISPFPYDLVRALASVKLPPLLMLCRSRLTWTSTRTPILCGARQALVPIPLHRFRLTFQQEEPLNNGAWTYVGPRILTAANQTESHKGKYPLYAGRDPTSSVATGSKVCICPTSSPMISLSHVYRLCTRNRSRPTSPPRSVSDIDSVRFRRSSHILLYPSCICR